MMAPRAVAGEQARVGDLFVFQMKYRGRRAGSRPGWTMSVHHALMALLENQPRLADAKIAGGGSWGPGIGSHSFMAWGQLVEPW